METGTCNEEEEQRSETGAGGCTAEGPSEVLSVITEEDDEAREITERGKGRDDLEGIGHRPLLVLCCD